MVNRSARPRDPGRWATWSVIRLSDSPLSFLENAISDVGRWTWWTGDLTKSIQLEFSGVQLWFPPMTDGQPPSGQVALRFRSPTLVTFMARSDDPDLNTDSWPARFQNDEIGGFTVGYDEFTMSDAELAFSMISDATHRIQMVGQSPHNTAFANNTSWIAFWAGPVRIVVAAAEMEIVSHHGFIRLDEVEAISGKWWEYWREYWDKKDSATPLPQDYACEVTIPAGPD